MPIRTLRNVSKKPLPRNYSNKKKKIKYPLYSLKCFNTFPKFQVEMSFTFKKF